MEPNPQEKLHSFLVESQLYSKSFKEFEQQFSTPEKRAKLHRFMVDNDVYSKSINDFQLQFFPEPVKKKVSSKDSAFNWQTGSVDVAKLSSAQPPARTAAKSSDPRLDSLRKTLAAEQYRQDTTVETVQDFQSQTREQRALASIRERRGTDYSSSAADMAKGRIDAAAKPSSTPLESLHSAAYQMSFSDWLDESTPSYNTDQRTAAEFNAFSKSLSDENREIGLAIKGIESKMKTDYGVDMEDYGAMVSQFNAFQANAKKLVDGFEKLPDNKKTQQEADRINAEVEKIQEQAAEVQGKLDEFSSTPEFDEISKLYDLSNINTKKYEEELKTGKYDHAQQFGKYLEYRQALKDESYKKMSGFEKAVSATGTVILHSLAKVPQSVASLTDVVEKSVGLEGETNGAGDVLQDIFIGLGDDIQAAFPAPTKLQRGGFTNTAKWGDYQVDFTADGDIQAIRDKDGYLQKAMLSKQQQAEIMALKKERQFNSQSFAYQAGSTIADVGIQILGTKGIGGIKALPGLSASRWGSVSVAMKPLGTQFGMVATTAGIMANDLYKEGLDNGLSEEDAARYALATGTSIGLVGTLAGVGIEEQLLLKSKLPSIGLRNKIPGFVGKKAYDVVSGGLGELTEEIVLEKLAQAGVQYAMNEMSGGKFDIDPYKDTTAIINEAATAFAVGGLFGLAKKGGKPSSMELSMLSDGAKDVPKTIEAVKELAVAAGQPLTITEEETLTKELETTKAAIQKIPEDQKTNPDVVETMVEKTKVDEEISAKKEEIKSIDPAFQQDAKNDIAALEVKSAELALQVAEKAGVTPDEKAVKLLEPKDGEPKPVAKEPEAPKMEPVMAGELEVGKTYYNEDMDRNYVFAGVGGNGMMLFDKVPKKGEVLMTTRVDSFPESNFMKKLFGSKTEQAVQEPAASQPQEPQIPQIPAAQEPISPSEPIASGMAQEAIVQANPPVDEVKKTVLAKRAYEGGIREEVKVYLEEKGLTRERVSQAVRSQQASDMVDDLGEDVAVEAVKMGEVKGALASSTLFTVMKRIDERMSATEDPADMDYLAKKQADLMEMLNDMAFEGGEFNSQFAREYIESDIGWNLAVKKSEYVKMFGSIPAEVEARFEELDAQLKELKAKLVEAEARATKAADADTIEAIKAEADKKKPSKASIAAIGKEMAKKIRKGKLSRPGTFSAASPASLVWDTAIEIAATSVEAGTALIEAVQKGVEYIRASAWYNSISSDKQATAEQEYIDFLTGQEDSVGKLKIPKSLIRDLVASGINDIDSLVGAVRAELGLAEESDRDIRDAITDYGKTIKMTKDDISVEVRRLRRVGRLISALEDVADKKRPLRSGLQRDKMTAEERSLQKQLKEEMKGLPMDEETLVSEQRTALDAAKKRLENQIEDLEREIELGEQVKRTAKTFDGDQELEDLRRKRDEVKKEHDELFKNEEFLNAKRLESTKKRTKKSIAELERRLAEKDFAKKEVKPLLEDTELINLRAEKLKIKEEFDKAFYAAEVKNRKLKDNIISGIWEAWGLTRVLTASLDASFMFVQGGVMTISNPMNAVKAVQEVMKVMGSEAKAEEFARKMKSQDWYPLAKQSRLALTEAHTGIKSSEELFFSGWSDFLWNGIMMPFKLAGERAYNSAVAKNPFKATERAAVAYLDTLRILKFQEMLDGPLKGKTFSENKQEFKDVADAINTLTGRASLGKLETISQPLTKLIFSPRNWASQIKMFSPYSIYYFSNLTPSARKMALLSLGKFVAFNTAMMVLLAARFNNDDDEKTNVEFDPRSSDFMKLKLGDIRVDPWGGKIQQVTFASRMIMDTLFDLGIGSGGFKNKSGAVMPLGMKNKTSDKKDLILQQVFNKLSPSARLVYNYTNAQRVKDGKQDDFGNEYSMTEDVKKALYPMYIGTIAELQEDGFDVTDSILTFFTFMGYGVNKYGQEKKKEEKK